MTETISPFDFINSISENKKDILAGEPHLESEYNSWIVNKGLSLFPDTVLYANMMNLNAHLDNKLKYDYLLNSIRPSKRRSKWPKKLEDNDLNAIKQYYSFNDAKAESALALLSPEQLQTIKDRLNTGGST